MGRFSPFFSAISSMVGLSKPLQKLTPSYRAAAAREQVPHIEVLVSGFEVSVQKHPGVKLHHNMGTPANPVKKPATQDWYYEVSLRPNGTNPEYPEISSPLKFVFTKSLDGSKGMSGGVMYISEKEDFRYFCVEEVYIADTQNVSGALRGTPFPPHHQLNISAYTSEDGARVQRSVAVGTFVPQSVLQSAAWKNAATSPVIGSAF